ncbi:MAG: nuclear transport factor 2 family protein [Mycobacteriales bacterium]
MTAEELVDRQVDAYNRHDLEAFLACYAREVTVRGPDGSVTLDGIEAIGSQYGGWFTSLPELRVEVRGRLTSGSWVVDEEHVVLGGGRTMSGLVAYRVEEDLIRDVVLLAADQG